MSQNKIESLEKAHIRILHRGIFIDIFSPVVIFFLAIYVREKFLNIQSIKDIDLLFYVLLIISLGEIFAIFILIKDFGKLSPITNHKQIHRSLWNRIFLDSE